MFDGLGCICSYLRFAYTVVSTSCSGVMSPKKRQNHAEKVADVVADAVASAASTTPPPPVPPKKTKKGKEPEPCETMPPPPAPPKKTKRGKEDQVDEPKPKSKRSKPVKDASTADPKTEKKGDQPKRYKDKLEAPDFTITWDNHHRLVEFYEITEAEASEILLNVVGPHPNGQAYWNRFKVQGAKPAEGGDTVGNGGVEGDDLGPPKHYTREELELMTDSQLPATPSVATTRSESGSTGSGVDNLETQVELAEEKDVQPKKPQPTPARSSQVRG